MGDKRDSWEAPYWATLYHGIPFVRTFEELDEWAKEEQAMADEREKESERAAGEKR